MATTEILLIGSMVLLLILLAIVLWLLARSPKHDPVAQMATECVRVMQHLESLERALREELKSAREETNAVAHKQRIELNQSFDQLTRKITDGLEAMRGAVEDRLDKLREGNERKLEEMRATVDEKLHATLERRLGESFRQVSEQLEQVHKGLGEMQSLASGVGDLKKMLANVKSRGTWGEIQLGTLLDQILTPEQYATNVATKAGSADRVEFAIRLPSKERGGAEVLLPLDAKFPLDVYQRLVEAADQADKELLEKCTNELEARIKLEARRIKEKYLDPPQTTDFAILFLPTEGLYAEVTRRPGLVEMLQREFRVTVMGPTTVAAFLNSLQMGFRTLAIEKRSSEVWTLLGAVKTEFGRFGDLLDKTHKKLQEASTTIDDAARRSRAIERKLRDVQHLPSGDAARVLGDAPDDVV
ncbi:MAG: DNA recombination protein RmuC [Ignavibacteria bacterium]